MKSRADAIFVVAVRHLSLEREMAALKVTKKKDIYVFPPYSLDKSSGLDTHISLHGSGERHAVARFRKDGGMEEVADIRKKSVAHFGPLDNLKGSVQIFGFGDVLGQFRGFRPAGTTAGQQILLDAEKAGFRDNAIALSIYAVEPGNEDCVPIALDTGARVLYFIKTTNPWIAIDLYQQKDTQPQISPGH